MKQKLVLAYSGGLDTSVILKWLVNKGYEVVAYVADVGQREDFEAVKKKALATGASKVYVLDLKRELVEDYVFEAMKANAIYEGRYLLGTALARPLIAKKHVEIAEKEGTNVLAHGCTGKGNDQVRFELTWMRFMPHVKIVSPWKDKEWLAQFKGRSDMIKYAGEQGIPISATLKKPYSIDENLVHMSYESGILEDPACEPDEGMFKTTVSPMKAPDSETKISIEFDQGVPVKVVNASEGGEITGSLEIFQYLNKLGGENGVGRIDIVENRHVGIKSRGVYETPGGTILFKAHQDLESITLDKEVMHLKELLSPMIAKLIYNGMWYSPEMEFLMAAIEKSQENVSGEVGMSLYKGNAAITGRSSPNSLYGQAISSMDEEGGYNQEDAKGFINITGLRMKLAGLKEARTHDGGIKHEAVAKKVQAK